MDCEGTWYTCYNFLFSDALFSNSLPLLKHSSSSGRILRKRIHVCPFVNTFWVSAIAICRTLWLTWKREKWLELTLATPSVRPHRYLIWFRSFVIYSLVYRLLLIDCKKRSNFLFVSFQFLPVPELMPFRLTRQFINLMLPLKESGTLQSVMVHTLRALRSNHELLVNTMDVFIKEPSLDWQVWPAFSFFIVY